MADTIKHQGIVENINGTHLQVRIVQTSACAACSIKGHCTSADAKEKLIDVTDEAAAGTYRPCMGDGPIVYGRNGRPAGFRGAFSGAGRFSFCFYGYLERRTRCGVGRAVSARALLFYIVAEQVAFGKEIFFFHPTDELTNNSKQLINN